MALSVAHRFPLPRLLRGPSLIAAAAGAASRRRRCLRPLARAPLPPHPPLPPALGGPVPRARRRDGENEHADGEEVGVKERIMHVELHKEATEAYMSYAMSLLLGRALPDGLKPVHRRILSATPPFGAAVEMVLRCWSDLAADHLLHAARSLGCGIGIILAGFVPTEYLRFRDESLTLKIVETQENAEEIEAYYLYRYPTIWKTLGDFKLTVMEGLFTDSQIVVMIGENGTRRTAFIRMLAGQLKPDTVEGIEIEISEFNVSYKPHALLSSRRCQLRASSRLCSRKEMDALYSFLRFPLASSM